MGNSTAKNCDLGSSVDFEHTENHFVPTPNVNAKFKHYSCSSSSVDPPTSYSKRIAKTRRDTNLNPRKQISGKIHKFNNEDFSSLKNLQALNIDSSKNAKYALGDKCTCLQDISQFHTSSYDSDSVSSSNDDSSVSICGAKDFRISLNHPCAQKTNTGIVATDKFGLSKYSGSGSSLNKKPLMFTNVPICTSENCACISDAEKVDIAIHNHWTSNADITEHSSSVNNRSSVTLSKHHDVTVKDNSSHNVKDNIFASGEHLYDCNFICKDIAEKNINTFNTNAQMEKLCKKPNGSSQEMQSDGSSVDDKLIFPVSHPIDDENILAFSQSNGTSIDIIKSLTMSNKATPVISSVKECIAFPSDDRFEEINSKIIKSNKSNKDISYSENKFKIDQSGKFVQLIDISVTEGSSVDAPIALNREKSVVDSNSFCVLKSGIGIESCDIDTTSSDLAYENHTCSLSALKPDGSFVDSSTYPCAKSNEIKSDKLDENHILETNISNVSKAHGNICLDKPNCLLCTMNSSFKQHTCTDANYIYNTKNISSKSNNKNTVKTTQNYFTENTSSNEMLHPKTNISMETRVFVQNNIGHTTYLTCVNAQNGANMGKAMKASNIYGSTNKVNVPILSRTPLSDLDASSKERDTKNVRNSNRLLRRDKQSTFRCNENKDEREAWYSSNLSYTPCNLKNKKFSETYVNIHDQCDKGSNVTQHESQCSERKTTELKQDTLSNQTGTTNNVESPHCKSDCMSSLYDGNSVPQSLIKDQTMSHSHTPRIISRNIDKKRLKVNEKMKQVVDKIPMHIVKNLCVLRPNLFNKYSDMYSKNSTDCKMHLLHNPDYGQSLNVQVCNDNNQDSLIRLQESSGDVAGVCDADDMHFHSGEQNSERMCVRKPMILTNPNVNNQFYSDIHESRCPGRKNVIPIQATELREPSFNDGVICSSCNLQKAAKDLHLEHQRFHCFNNEVENIIHHSGSKYAEIIDASQSGCTLNKQSFSVTKETSLNKLHRKRSKSAAPCPRSYSNEFNDLKSSHRRQSKYANVASTIPPPLSNYPRNRKDNSKSIVENPPWNYSTHLHSHIGSIII